MHKRKREQPAPLPFLLPYDDSSFTCRFRSSFSPVVLCPLLCPAMPAVATMTAFAAGAHQHLVGNLLLLR